MEAVGFICRERVYVKKILDGHGLNKEDVSSSTLHHVGHFFLDGSVVKNPPANARGSRNSSSIPGSGRSPGKGNGNLL